MPVLLLNRTLLAIACLAGCHAMDVGNEGGLVGGSCRNGRDCAERCARGDAFPDGTCTLDCRDDFDCPDGTYCVEVNGGVCLLGCDVNRDCRSAYECDPRDREGRGGRVDVCIDDDD